MGSKTIQIDACRKTDLNYKDVCQKLQIKGCNGCWCHGIRIIEYWAKKENL